MSLTYKLLLSIIVPIIVLASFVFLTTLTLSNNYLLKTYQENQLNDLRVVEIQIKKEVETKVRFLKSAAILITNNYNDKNEIRKILFSFAKQDSSILHLSLLNRQGKEYIRFKFNNFKNMYNSPIFQNPLKNKKIYVSELIPDKERLKPTFDISIPIFHKNKLLSVLWAKIDAKYFYDLMKYYIPQEGVFVLADLDIDEPIIRIKIPNNLGVQCIKLIESTKFHGEKQGTFNTKIDGIPFTVIFKKMKLNNIDYALIALKSDRTLYAFKNILLMKHISIVLPGLVLILLFITFRIKRNISPLKYLIEEINELTDKYKTEENEDNYLKDIEEKDEIKLLKRSFNTFVEQMDKYSDEITQINKELGNCIERAEGENQTLEKIVNKKVKQIKYQVYHDILTGLPNRRLLTDRLEMAIAYCKRNKKSLALLFLDLDDFKNINDSLGHQIGDVFLKEVAKRLLSCCRDIDTVSRFGGDEFVIILSDAQSNDDAAEVAERILQQLSLAFNIDGNYISTSTSIGIAIYPKDGMTSEELLKNADVAMYSSKRSGKNKFTFFNQKMNKDIINKIAIENSLRKAIERDEFKLLYQPKVSLKTGKIAGVEALVRWQKDDDTLVPPSKFIFIAEESDVICLIGEWVLRKACQDIIKIHNFGFSDVTVAVNISARQFQDPNFINLTKKILNETGLKPHYLNIEITENTVMHDIKSAIEIMKKFNDLNVKISIDDFGTGYSSLNYLKKFPVHYLKIDRSFVKDIPINVEDVAIAKSIMSLAHSLYLNVVAEGVETWEHLKFLKENNCDEIQGSFVSMPIAAPQLLQMLRKGTVLI